MPAATARSSTCCCGTARRVRAAAGGAVRTATASSRAGRGSCRRCSRSTAWCARSSSARTSTRTARSTTPRRGRYRLAYGMPDAELTGRVPLGARVTEPPRRSGLGTVPAGSYAYLLDWSDYYAPKRALPPAVERCARGGRVRAVHGAHTHRRARVSARLDLDTGAAQTDRSAAAARAGARGRALPACVPEHGDGLLGVRARTWAAAASGRSRCRAC
jgi:hypothetical protein